MTPPPTFTGRLAGLVAFTVALPAVAQTFQQQTTTRFPTQSEYTNQLTFVDLDLDGDLDIVFANGQGYTSAGVALKPRVFINDGTGVFADQTDARVAGVTGWFRGVEAGDVDRDGDPDLLLVQDFAKKPKLLMNDGAGVFTDGSVRLPNLNLSSARGQFGDVDNDGDLDIVVLNSGTTSRFSTNGRPRLYLNDGTGTFTDAPAGQVPAANVPEQMDAVFFDCDNDLDLDLFIGTRAAASQLWINNGAGTFTKLASGMPVGGSSYSYDPGDIDGDGDLDLIGVNSGTSNTELLLKNNGTGTVWTNSSSSLVPNPTTDDNDSRFFDFDMDGDLDLIVATLGSSSERIYVNNGTGSFTIPANVISGQTDSSLDVKVADLTGDGKIDIVTAQGESGAFQNRIYVGVNAAVDNRPPTVKLTEQVPNGPSTGPFVVRAEVFDDYANDRGFEEKSVALVYAVDGGKPVSVPMAWSGFSLYRGVIPALPACSEVTYFVRATDRRDNVGTGPVREFTVEGSCSVVGDLDGNGVVNAGDLAALLAAWGGKGGPADLDGDGTVGASDLAILLAAWTP
jgi:DNA/RNA endonuclease YhcR with UshA esterase domain